MASLFFAPPPPPLPPEIEDSDEIEKERRRQLAIHSGGSVLGSSNAPNSNLLGSAAQLGGAL